MAKSFVHLHVHSEFCLSPETRVAKADLTWAAIADIKVGDVLVGFDENLQGSKMKRTVVESTRRLIMPSYKVTMSDGSTIVSSSLHYWVVLDGPGNVYYPDGPKRNTGSNQRKWCKTEDLIPGLHRVVKWATPWEQLADPEDLYKAGYLAGILDGEGWIASTSGELGLAQNAGSVYDKIKTYLDDLAFKTADNFQSKDNNCIQMRLAGYEEAIRFGSQCGGAKFKDKSDAIWVGRRAGGKITKPVMVNSIEFIGETEVIGIQTTERTFVAEGFLTHNSMLDGAAKIDPMVKTVAQDGQPALAITDHGNMYGAMSFYKSCVEHGVKPIIGMEAYQAQDKISERFKMKKKTADDTGESGVDGGNKLYYHLTTLAENNTGYSNLIKLSSESFVRPDAYYYKPRCDWDMLSEFSDGLIATSGCLGGQILQALMRDDYSVARHTAAKFQDIFGKDNFFIEIQDHGLTEQNNTNPMLVKLSKDIGAPLDLTNDSHYVSRSDHVSHDALLCCQTKSKLSDKDRFKFEGNEHYVKTAAEMRGLFPDLDIACDNTLLIAERCNVQLETNIASLPHIEIPEGYEDSFEYLMEKCIEGCIEKYGTPLPSDVRERLEYEINMVNSMNFIDYFLIVADLIDYAKKRGIRVGPGRGSAAGSIIAFSLGITDIDPLKYGLLFERFLNPARVSMPDIDMDWDTRYREEMVNYCIDKYGYDHVANIITYSTIKSRAAIRDTVRVLDLPFAVGNKVIDLMPPIISGFETPLEFCFQESPRYQRGFSDAKGLRKLYKDGTLSVNGEFISNEEVKRIIDIASGLEGLRRQDGVHAAAVVLSDKPLTNYLPVQRKPSKDGSLTPLVTQYDMNNVEELGLLKMDFLGLKNLDIITDTIKLIKERRGIDVEVDYGKLDLTDGPTLSLVNSGFTSGVFQIESLVMRDTIKTMGVDRFEDIAALNALCRPGPMADGMHFAYGDRKNGRALSDTFHSDAEEILEETYNLMIYQEQLMAIANKFAGYSLGEAYLLLKACAKKKPELMAKERIGFVQGCINNGYSEELGNEIFDIIEPFASYSFNKSHAVAYGFISFQTAFLKANYPVEYMSCLLSANMHKADKLPVYLNECSRMGIKILPPHINKSRLDFFPISDNEISFGFEAVKNIGHEHALKIIEERDLNGKYSNFFDFVNRTIEFSNISVINALIMTGAFEESRLGLKGLVDDYLKQLRKRLKKTSVDQMTLLGDDSSLYPEVPKIEISPQELLDLEMEYLGMYISSHPLKQVVDLPLDLFDISDVLEFDYDSNVKIAGVIDLVDIITTRKGDRMARVTLQDLSGTAVIIVFPRLFNKISFLLKKGMVLKVDALFKIENDGRSQIIAEDINEL